MRPEMRREVVHRTRCRGCDASDLETVLSLGETPLANAFLRSPADFAGERSYPLDLCICSRCGLAQLADVVDPEILFAHYLYVTGTAATMAAHNRAYAETIIGLLSLSPGDRVAEIGSNDGSLLRSFAARGIHGFGIDPARNIATEATASGIDTVNAFFTRRLGAELRAARGPVRAVMANNVLAHVDDPRDLLAGCRELIADDGVVSVEVPYAGELLERVEYDTIYHEHLSYFALAPLLRLAESAGLRAVRVDRIPVHGGSIRAYLSKTATEHAPDVRAFERAEERLGLTRASTWREFAGAVERSREHLVGLLESEAASGRRVAGYGAPAKGNTLLNYCGIGPRLLPFIVDRNPRKVGLFTPGSHIPVRDVSALYDESPAPDDVLILAWNLADEIVRQEQRHRDRGGRFIVPVPVAQVV